eukprot:scaffold90712_cov63-Phaeocystis_antarctica.AAC.5
MSRRRGCETIPVAYVVVSAQLKLFRIQFLHALSPRRRQVCVIACRLLSALLAAASRMSLAATSHLNDGNVYAETVPAAAAGQRLLDFLACRYTHSSREAWSAPTPAARHHRRSPPPLPLTIAARHHQSPPPHTRHSSAPLALTNPLPSLQVSPWRGRPHLPGRRTLLVRTLVYKRGVGIRRSRAYSLPTVATLTIMATLPMA